MSLRLSITPASVPLRTPTAWFVPGASPREWLAELVTWATPPRGPVLFAVPGDAGGAVGLLVIGRGLNLGSRPSPRAQPYGQHGRIVLPTAAVLDTPVAARELDSVVGDVLLLHPVAGLVAFRFEDALALRDLIAAPARQPGGWLPARRGDPPLPPLRSIGVDQTISLQQLLTDARGDIAKEPPAEIPEEPSEGAGAGGNPAKWAGGQLAKAARWFTGKSKGEDDPTWIDKLETWSAAAREKLQNLRERELERLLGLMEQDPDKGLRYALPLSGENDGRGVSNRPGALLGPRDLNLDLNRPQGGTPSDPWEVDPELYSRLRSRYREAANRELRLGRTKRAAYIFLQLLGDGQAAANALEQGRHYREAALLYRERLNKLLDAARCLERGGLLLEAAEIYEAEHRYADAAEIFRKLERHEEAERAFRLAARAHQDAGDVRSAARVLEEKVGVPDEALHALAETWPHGSQAAGCLQDRFSLLGRLGRHEATAKLVREFQSTLAPSAREAHLVECLVKVADDYPDRDVRTQASDAARVVAGTALPLLRPTVAERMVRAVARLDSNDRLLGRDVRRFVSNLRSQRARGPRKLSEVIWDREFRLPEDVEWHTAAPLGGGFLLAGVGPSGPAILRSDWEGAAQWSTWSKRHTWPGPLLLAAPETIWEQEGGPIVLAYPGHPLPLLTLPATDAFPYERPVGTPSWLPEGALAIAAGGASVWAITLSAGELVLAGMDGSTGALFSSEHIVDQSPFEELPPLTLLAHGLRLVLARGAHLEVRHGQTVVETVELEHEVVRLCAAHHDCVAVSTRSGGAVLWRRGQRYETHRFAAGLAAPHLAFTDDGRLVALTPFEARVYSTDGYGLRHLTTFAGPGEDVVALLPTQGGMLATISPRGRVRLFHVPAG